MKKIATLSVAICSLALATSAAHAAKPGVYLGLGQGYSTLQTPDNINYNYSPTGAYDNDRNGRGGQLFVGYNFNEMFGAELNLAGYATATNKATVSGATSKVEYSLAALSLVGKAYFPISNSGIDFYALGGITSVASKTDIKDTSVDANGNTYSGDQINKAYRPKFGAGVNYTFPESNWTAGLEVSRILGKGDVKEEIGAIPTADVIGLTVAYNFG